jgi:hypothetical protein
MCLNFTWRFLKTQKTNSKARCSGSRLWFHLLGRWSQEDRGSVLSQSVQKNKTLSKNQTKSKRNEQCGSSGKPLASKLEVLY